ncbi:MAG: hypothetical protein ACRYG4_03320 [Janthinobacterium lividum]
MTSAGKTLRPSLALIALALAPAAMAKKAPPAPAPEVITSRMVVEKQLAAQSTVSGSAMTNVEARRIHDRYLSRMGVPLEASDTSGSGGSNGGSRPQ